MSSVIQNKESIEKLNTLLVNYSLDYFVEEGLNDLDWVQYTSHFPMTIDNKYYATLKDYVINVVNKGFEFGGDNLNSEAELVIDLITKTSYINHFGGSISLDSKDLGVVEKIRVFSESFRK